MTERSQTVFCWKKPPPSNREASAGLLPSVTEHRNAIHFDKIALHSAMSDRFAVICIRSSSRAVQSGQCITFACSAVWAWLQCKVKVCFNKVQSNVLFLAHYVAICFKTYMQSSWWKEVLSVIEYGLQYKFAEQGHSVRCPITLLLSALTSCTVMWELQVPSCKFTVLWFFAKHILRHCKVETLEYRACYAAIPSLCLICFKKLHCELWASCKLLVASL